jgi:hypothetical protein
LIQPKVRNPFRQFQPPDPFWLRSSFLMQVPVALVRSTFNSPTSTFSRSVASRRVRSSFFGPCSHSPHLFTCSTLYWSTFSRSAVCSTLNFPGSTLSRSVPFCFALLTTFQDLLPREASSLRVVGNRDRVTPRWQGAALGAPRRSGGGKLGLPRGSIDPGFLARGLVPPARPPPGSTSQATH